jgi:hypothetical protein
MLHRFSRILIFRRLQKIGCLVMDAEDFSATGDGPRPQFGNRHLKNPDDVYQHNAWDDVQWDAEQEQHAKNMVAQNSEVSSNYILKIKKFNPYNGVIFLC